MTSSLLNDKISKNNATDFSQEQHDKLLKKDDLAFIDTLMSKHFNSVFGEILEKINNIKDVLEKMSKESLSVMELKK